MPGTILSQLTGQQRSLIDHVTITNAKKNPLIGIIPKGGSTQNVMYEYPVDLEATPADNAAVDGTDIDSFGDAEENYTMLAGRCQWSRRAYMTGALAEADPVAGIKNHRAYAVKHAMTALWADIEGTLGSDQDVVVGSGSLANRCRGIGDWIQTSIGSGAYAVPAAFCPASGAVATGASSGLTPAVLNTVLQNVWAKGGVSGDETLPLITGATIKNIITTFPQETDEGTSHPAATGVSVYNVDASSKTVWRTVRKFMGDYGNIDIIPTLRNALAGFTGGSAAYSLLRGYLINPKYLDMIWRWTPKVMALPDGGGGERFMAHAYWGLRNRKPDAHGSFRYTS